MIFCCSVREEDVAVVDRGIGGEEGVDELGQRVGGSDGELGGNLLDRLQVVVDNCFA